MGKNVGGAYGVLRGFSLGGSAPQTPRQGGSAPLDPPKYGPVTPQDGLVTPPLWKLRADLFKKRPKFAKNRQNRIKIPFGGIEGGLEEDWRRIGGGLE